MKLNLNNQVQVAVGANGSLRRALSGQRCHFCRIRASENDANKLVKRYMHRGVCAAAKALTTNKLNASSFLMSLTVRGFGVGDGLVDWQQ